MNTKKIVITGGPSTGKTSIIKELTSQGYHCLEEISRQITLEARKNGTEQLFLSDPLRFSEKLIDGRINQFRKADSTKKEIIFIDRGIPDVLAYMDYIKCDYPNYFINACAEFRYDQVFILAPWQKIYTSDNERYENFEQALEIHQFLLDTYKRFSYNLIDVPFGNVLNRTNFILNSLM